MSSNKVANVEGEDEEEEEEEEDEDDDENDEEEVEEEKVEDNAKATKGEEVEEEDDEEEEDSDDGDDTAQKQVDNTQLGSKRSHSSVTIDLTEAENAPPLKKGREFRSQKPKKESMVEEIEEMMYGFGDTHAFPPDEASVSLIKSLVTNYIEDMAMRALEVSEVRNKESTAKLDKDCFLFIVRKDRAKFQRIFRLLKANDELKNVQKLEIREDSLL